MPEGDIFNPAAATTTEGTALEQLVGEGKKYKSVEDLAKAYANADSHITELKTDLQSTREFIAEELKKLAEQRSNPTPPAQTEETGGKTPAPVAPPNGEVEDLDTRIAKALEERDTNKRLQGNANLVQDVLVERLGSVEKATEAVIAKARELGVDGTYMKQTAANSPRAFFSLMGINPDEKPASSSTPAPRSDVNPTMVNSGAPKPRTYKFHEEVRKSNPKLYNTVAYQSQLMKDALELGQDFFN
jgi:hypothetical protein